MAKGRVKNHGVFTENEWKYVQAWEGDDGAAAHKIGVSPKTAANYMKKPYVIEAIRTKQDAMAKAAGKKLGEKSPVSRDGIINRLWELATMTADQTNFNITGQVKAAAELAEIYRMKVKLSADMTDKFKGKSKEELDHYAIHGTWPERRVGTASVGGGAVSSSPSGAGSKPV